jgi:hypothetical protein
MGHAFASSNFPAPGGVFYGLTMGAVIPLPGAPTGFSVTSGNTKVFLNWTAPLDNVYLVITNYRVYRSTIENGTYVFIASALGLNYTDTDLINGQTFWYKVSAVTAAGEGTQSPAVSVLVSQLVNPASDNTILMLVAMIAIAAVLVAALLIVRKRKDEK